jgi:integrase
MADNLYRRGKTWWGRIQVAGADIRRSLRTSDRTEAKRRLKAWKDEISHARHFGEARLTWQDAVTRYVTEVMPGSIKASTAKRYLVSFRQLAPHMHGRFVDTLAMKDIASVVGKRKTTGATNATIKRDLTAASRVFASARAWGASEHNPVREYLDQGLVRERRDPITLPTDAEVREAVAKLPPSDPKRRVILLADQSGMREGEILTLTWPQVDMLRGISLDRTKTDAPRVVPLTDPLLAEAVGTLSGTPRREGCPFVFWHSDGQPYRNFPAQFASWRRVNGVAFRFHDLRHKFAVGYLRRGGNIYALQKILGHKSIKTTEIYLAYLTPDEAERAKNYTAQIPAQM